jgi:DNA-binding CsgD family transcriptional regulator/small-conductance mechanosensitive channel
VVWIVGNSLIFIPLLFFLSAVFIGVLLFFLITHVVTPWSKRIGHSRIQLLIASGRILIIPCFFLLGIFLGVHFSTLPPDIQTRIDRISLSLLVFMAFWLLIGLAANYVRSRFTGFPHPALRTMLNIIRIVFGILAVLLILGIWDAPTQPLSIVFVALIVFSAISLRDFVPNLIAGIEIVVNGYVKPGHLVKLESGETGSVVRIHLTNTVLRTSEGNIVIIPNNRLVGGLLVNYGETDEMEKASEPAKLLGSLTARELEVLRSIATGATNREIAQMLILSEHTVKSHLRSILGKLNLRNRQQVAAFAEREGLNTNLENSE